MLQGESKGNSCVATASWVTEYQTDGLDGDPEYKVAATVDNSSKNQW